MARKPYQQESDDGKIMLLLKWIMQDEPYEQILSGQQVIKNITIQLNKMNYNGYLRLFDIELNILKNYMSDTSWNSLQDFASKRRSDSWVCPHCKHLFVSNEVKWRCERCLFWYHRMCAQPKELHGENTIFILCFSCLFEL